jgi:hypothetical protein
MQAGNKLRLSKTLFLRINLCSYMLGARQTQCCWPNACAYDLSSGGREIMILRWCPANLLWDLQLYTAQGLHRLLSFHRALAGWLLCFVLFLLLVCGWTIIKAAVTLLYTAASERAESRAEKRAFRPNCGAKPRAEASLARSSTFRRHAHGSGTIFWKVLIYYIMYIAHRPPVAAARCRYWRAGTVHASCPIINSAFSIWKSSCFLVAAARRRERAGSRDDLCLVGFWTWAERLIGSAWS